MIQASFPRNVTCVDLYLLGPADGSMFRGEIGGFDVLVIPNPSDEGAPMWLLLRDREQTPNEEDSAP